MVNLQSWVDKNLADGLVPQIFDRHRLISELIYGPIMRNQAEPGFTDLDWLPVRLSLFYSLKPLIIYCLPSLETVKANLADDPDNVAVVDKAEAIYQAYVGRISLDYEFAPRKPLVWNYEETPTLEENPVVRLSTEQYINNLIDKENTLW